MTRARVKPRASSAPGVHLDVGAPAARELPASEFTVGYIGPERDDPETEAAVVAWIARLLRRQVER